MARTAKHSGSLKKSIARRSWPRALLVLLLLGLIGLPAYLVACQAWGEYLFQQAKDDIRARDFAKGRERLDQSLRLRPGSLETGFWAARTARRDRDYKIAK